MPDFAMLMLAGGITGMGEQRQLNLTEEEPVREDRVERIFKNKSFSTHFMIQKRGRVTQEVRCKGIPKFTCDFVYDYEACSHINKLEAAKCDHRKDVTKCPLQLETKDGCIIETLLTNKGAKIIAGKTKISCENLSTNNKI